MTEVNDKIISKIKKCLALAQSDNAGEAAAALRQANALMRKHGLDIEAIEVRDICEQGVPVKTLAYDKVSAWEVTLADTICRAFGCKMLLEKVFRTYSAKSLHQANFIFIGTKNSVALAAYTFDVLSSKCKKARAAWIKKMTQNIETSGKGVKQRVTALGDEFSLGWVAQISRLVIEFAHPDETQRAIAAYFDNRRASESKKEQARLPKQTTSQAAAAMARSQGAFAAKDERIHRPVAGQQQTLLV